MSSIQRQSEPEPQEAIIRLRGQAVILDSDLAELYGFAMKVFKQAVQRNLDRFPADFMFQLISTDTAAKAKSGREIGFHAAGFFTTLPRPQGGFASSLPIFSFQHFSFSAFQLLPLPCPRSKP